MSYILKLRSQIQTWVFCPSEKDLRWFLLFAFLFFLVRLPDHYWIGTFWAEDGSIFFREDYELGPSAFFKGYSGYLHVLLRLVAFIIGYFPLSVVPYLYKISSISIHFLVSLYVASPRTGLSPKKRSLMILAPFLIPHGGEVFGNLANQITIAGILIVLIPTLVPSSYFFQRIVDSVLFGLCTISCPHSVFLFPFIGLYLYFKKKDSSLDKKWSFFLGLILVFGVLTQFSFMDSKSRFSFIFHLNDWHSVFHHTLSPFLISKLPVPTFIADLVGLFLIIAIWRIIFSSFNFRVRFNSLWVNFRSRESLRSLFAPFFSKQEILWIISGFLTLAAAFFVSLSNLGSIKPYGHGGRYFYLFYVTLYWALVSVSNVKEEDINLRKWVLFLPFFSSFFYLPSGLGHNEYGFEKSVEQYEKEGSSIIQINPLGWQFSIDRAKCWRCRPFLNKK